MLEEVVYALPIPYVAGFCADPNSILEVSMDGATGWIAVTIAADGGFFTAAPFIRTTDATADIIVKKY